MQKFISVIFALLIVFVFALDSIAAKKTGTGKKSFEETTTITAVIVKIDVATGKVALKEQNGNLQCPLKAASVSVRTK